MVDHRTDWNVWKHGFDNLVQGRVQDAKLCRNELFKRLGEKGGCEKIESYLYHLDSGFLNLMSSSFFN